MNLVYGEIVDIFLEDEIRMGRVRVGRALKNVPLDLLTDIECGDRVLLCDGVAISRVDDTAQHEDKHVSRDSR